MGNKPLLGISLGLLLLVLAVGLRYFGEGPSVKTVESDQAIMGHGKSEHHLHPQSMAVMKEPAKHDHHDHHDHDQAKANQPRHIDMLTEEMKQSIRDKLLQHGPMEVIHHPDGRIELPSNGRFTQMPVAVEMPDGSIVIKEYSELPQ